MTLYENKMSCYDCAYLSCDKIKNIKMYFCEKRNTDRLKKFPSLRKMKCFSKIEIEDTHSRF